MYNLVIVESPTKVKTIKKYLGSNYKVMASMGHIRDLPKSKLGLDVENGFVPQYITIRGKSKLLGGTVSSYNDHRIAMSAAVASAICENEVTILDASAVSKSYPDFWQDIKKLGFNVELK